MGGAGSPGIRQAQSAASAGAVLTATNGLTKAGTNVKLGGTLVENTGIVLGSNSFSLYRNNVSAGELLLAANNFAIAINANIEAATALNVESLGGTSGSYSAKFKNASGTLIMGIRSDGRVGINQNNPLSILHVTDGSILCDGTSGSTPTSGAGTRLMWIPAKNAFLAGVVSEEQWDDVNIGTGAFAFGSDVVSRGNYVVTFGIENSNTSDNSFIAGATGCDNSTASEQCNVILAANTTDIITASFGFAAGSFLRVSADNAHILGLGRGTSTRLINNIANSLMIGYNTDAPTLFVAGGDGTAGALANIGLFNKTTFGTSAVGVLGIGIKGTAPTTSPADMIQVYTDDHNGAGTATWHMRNEEGDTIVLFKGAALTGADANAVNTGDATTDAVINNMRTRINELEARLQANSLLT